MTNGSPEEIASALNARSVTGGWNTHCDASLQFETPQLIALAKLWRAKTDALDRPPSRADFDARELKTLLRNLAIVEQVGSTDPRYRFRYYGSEFVPLLGEQTGRFMDEFIPPTHLPRWTMGYEAVLALGTPLRFTSRFQLPQLSYLVGESFVGPLFAASSSNPLILCAMYVQPKHALEKAG
jgi:hypothetical protein